MLATEHNSPPATTAWPGPAAEAARYALLRRLAPSIRHHLVVNLQPIGMIHEVLDRRLRAAQPNIASVHDSAQKINGFARAALDSCIDVVSWLAPPDDDGCTVDTCARECAGLLASSLSFRGYTLRNEVGPLDGVVPRSAVRYLLCAAVIHATDELPPPAELVVRSAATPEGVRLTLALRQTDGDKGFVHEAAYRPLRWEDIVALAEAEGASAQRTPAGDIEMLVPWLRQVSAGRTRASSSRP